ncbi:MAG TPA: HAMP domain-containing sensor histidine kinase [Solirubrobacteraceae bacterium]|nr:HAMP domain-containing sensor histidine kinase [Solirubrobacteraceae bacterium]
MRRAFARLRPTGLRSRLAVWLALVMLLSMAIVFVVVYRGTGSQMRGQIDRDIGGDVSGLAGSLTVAHARSARGVSAAAARYVHSQPFGESSTLLFVLVPGAATSTNRPELFGPVRPDDGETLAEEEAERRLSRRLLTAPEGYSTVALADIGSLRLLKRVLRIRGGLAVTVGVGEPLAAVAHAQQSVARAFVLAGLLVLAGALLASYVLGARLSRPLRRMAAVAARVDAGDLYPRIHDPSGQGDEVKVLADAFNHMLDRLTDAFAGQRAFVADASHELRTPLTVIRGQLEVLAAQSAPPGEEVRRVERLVQAEIARVSRLVDDLLLLVKTEQAEFLQLERVDLGDYVRELWDGMSLIASRRFELDAVPEGVLRADPDRLAQALRNLLGNAIDHTAPERGLVRMRVRRAPDGRVRFIVEDDGPGIPVDQRERVFRRFHRTDAARDRASGGTGLGLAIVRAIADAHDGTVTAGASSEGGTRIELELPGFTPAHEATVAPA